MKVINAAIFPNNHTLSARPGINSTIICKYLYWGFIPIFFTKNADSWNAGIHRGWSGRNQRRTLFLSELRQSHAHLTCSFSYVNDRTLNVLNGHLLSWNRKFKWPYFPKSLTSLLFCNKAKVPDGWERGNKTLKGHVQATYNEWN